MGSRSLRTTPGGALVGADLAGLGPGADPLTEGVLAALAQGSEVVAALGLSMAPDADGYRRSMTPADLLADALARVLEDVEAVLDGADDHVLTHRPGPDANSIAWLVWHLTRVQDDHVADVAGTEQVWTAQGYADRFGLPLETPDIGYGHTSEQVAAVEAPASLLLDYHRTTHERSLAFLATVTPEDLDRVVDTRWDPPVTLGVRLVSVVNDCTQHVGQAAYLRGLSGR